MVPEPNMVSYLLFESPWPVVIALVGLWAVLRVIGVRQRKRGFHAAALVALALAVGVSALAWVVTTDREQVVAQTRRLVQATHPAESGPSKVDRTELDRMIEPAAPIAVHDGPTLMPYREVRPALSRLEVAGQSIDQLAAGLTQPDRAVSEVHLTTHLANPPTMRPAPSRWRFHWRRDDAGGWRVRKITAVEFNNQPIDDKMTRQIQGWLP